MGIQKDEIKTLVFYYQKWVAGSSSFPCKKPMDERLDRRLRDQGLIKLDIITGEMMVGLTPEGLRLGQKYNSKIGTITIWCTEYIWLWVILGAIIGAITLAVTIFKN